MAHRRSFQGRGISQAQRRKKSWIAFKAPCNDGLLFGDNTLTIRFSAPAGALLTSPQGQTVGFFSEIGEFPDEGTLMRIRGSLNLPKNTVGGGSCQNFAFGIGVMERTAAELGAVPNPASPEGAEWDGWMSYRTMNSSVVDAAGSIVDVKSMRKIQSGYALIVVVGSHETTTSVGGAASAPAIEAEFSARGLFLLP